MSFHSRRTTPLGAAAVAVLLAAGPAFAGVRPEIGVLFGALFADEELTGSQQDSNDIGPIVGLRGGLRMSDLLGLFADGIYSPIDASLPIEAGVMQSDASETAVRGGLEVYMPPRWGSGETFLAGAGGVMHAGFEDADGFTSPLVSLGLGQVYRVSDHGRFRWEVRGDHIFVDDEELVDDDMNQIEFLLGGSYMFGSEEPEDADGDGVTDDLDACPDTPSGWIVDPRGCPHDADGDGVSDGADKCPGTPRGATVDANGCPADADLDGVFDGIDRCPNTLAGVKVDATGCPEQQLFAPEQKTRTLERVNFHSNSAKLTDDSRQTLEEIAAAMKSQPEVRVEIGGHTDSQGDNAHNDDLSQKRAQAVKDFLVGQGVSASQLEAKGYGEEKPLADNSTPAGRAKNRRVELRRLD